MNKRHIGMVISGILGFALFVGFMHYVLQIKDAYTAGTSDSLSLSSYLFPIGLFFAAGACGVVWDQLRLSGESERVTSPAKFENSTWAKIDEGKLLGGLFALGIAIFEISSGYIAENYLVPTEDTDLLREFFSSSLFPILIGLFGVGLIFAGLKPLLGNSDED